MEQGGDEIARDEKRSEAKWDRSVMIFAGEIELSRAYGSGHFLLNPGLQGTGHR